MHIFIILVPIICNYTKYIKIKSLMLFEILNFYNVRIKNSDDFSDKFFEAVNICPLLPAYIWQLM